MYIYIKRNYQTSFTLLDMCHCIVGPGIQMTFGVQSHLRGKKKKATPLQLGPNLDSASKNLKKNPTKNNIPISRANDNDDDDDNTLAAH